MFAPIVNVDPVLQQITFGDYVFFQDDDKVKEPTLTLQTAVNVRSTLDNQLDCYTRIAPVPGASADTLPQIARRTDVQLEVTSSYDKANNLLKYGLLEADAILRADYYISGMLQPYLVSAAQTLEYNGIAAISLDGAISQVTWNVGPQGASTTASRNTEHDVNIPPYPARRRREYLLPAPDGRADILPREKP